jgi:hypothetical protein
MMSFVSIYLVGDGLPHVLAEDAVDLVRVVVDVALQG